MRATVRRIATGSTGSWRLIGLLAVLLVVGALLQACSNQGGSSGPSHPAGQTGTADNPTQIIVRVAINPNTIELGRRAGVTVLVTNTNGRPLQGRHVQLSTSVGQLDVVDGFTDADGKFVSALRVTAADVTSGQSSATVTAFVDGAVGSAVVNFAGLPALTLAPTNVTQKGSTTGPPCLLGGFTTQYTVSGGQPPYTFSTAGFGGSTITQNGLYSIPPVAIPQDGQLIDSVTVVDTQGTSVSGSVTIQCVKQT